MFASVIEMGIGFVWNSGLQYVEKYLPIDRNDHANIYISIKHIHSCQQVFLICSAYL